MPTKEYMQIYREKRRQEAIDYLGGQCVRCGTSDSLEIDHIDPRTKLFTVSGYTGSKAKFWTEVKKCQLLCQNCHKAKTREDALGDHGGSARYLQGCRCDECKVGMRDTRRRYNLSWRGRK